MDTEQIIITKLISQQSYYKKLISSLIDYRKALLENEPKEFIIEINKQFKEVALKVIADNLAKELAIGPDVIYSVLDNLNLEEYINV